MALPSTVAIDLHADRVPPLLGQLAQQPGGAGQQGEAAQQLDRQTEVGQRRPADPGAVQRQPATENLIMDTADRLEQRPGADRTAPSSVAILINTGVRGSPCLCTG